jgi:uncharacterized glyoxalase superfamily protein PhnB
MTDTLRERVSNPPMGMPRVLAHLVYERPGAAVEWLERVFGFRERTFARHIEADGSTSRTQLDVVDSVITVGLPSVHGDSLAHGVSTLLYVYVDDVSQHYQRTLDQGAEIMLPLEERAWGDRTYQVRDLEGYRWIFAEHFKDVELEDEHLGQ